MQALRPFGPECACPAPTAQEEAAGKAEGGFCVFGGSRFPSPVVLHPGLEWYWLDCCASSLPALPPAELQKPDPLPEIHREKGSGQLLGLRSKSCLFRRFQSLT